MGSLLNEKKKWAKIEIRKEVKDLLGFNENGYTHTQIYRAQMKAVLKGKFIALSAYIKKLEISY